LLLLLNPVARIFLLLLLFSQELDDGPFALGFIRIRSIPPRIFRRTSMCGSQSLTPAARSMLSFFLAVAWAILGLTVNCIGQLIFARRIGRYGRTTSNNGYGLRQVPGIRGDVDHGCTSQDSLQTPARGLGFNPSRWIEPQPQRLRTVSSWRASGFASCGQSS
jgi:hypothetical protein